jgi:D-arabinose 1-dehydrogenase-like Zn-dependent alcohol dehydrogenase
MLYFTADRIRHGTFGSTGGDIMKSTQVKVVPTKCAVVTAPGKAFKFEQRDIPTPEGINVLLKIHACGICHSDSFPFTGHFPGLAYPIIPGHEIVGTVEEVGPEVKRLKKGDRVGVGWHGGHCGHCTSCLRGDFIFCRELRIPGITRDGGYTQYAVFPRTSAHSYPKNWIRPRQHH